MLFDAFICHASEDKQDFVRPLAERLRERHIEVWYDEFALNVGDSLRRSIDRGLAQSRFGIVVLSHNFFAKEWPQWELDGLIARYNSEGRTVILPVWHHITLDEVLKYSPPLADKIAVNSSEGVDKVSEKLAAVIRPQGSTLIIARDHLLRYGYAPPVVTDDYWLDVAAAAESNDLEGDWQEPMGWGRWGFPLPPASRVPEERGWRLARAAMQTSWKTDADTLPITQITHPDMVHDFINSHPGLAETCQEHVHYLITYAPQLIITGFGGAFEERIDELDQLSVQEANTRHAADSSFGTALTTNHEPPRCDEEYALRHPEFCGYDAAVIACGFVQGNYVANGPPVKFYNYVDYAAWLLSESSSWLPVAVRSYLTKGMAEWGTWTWSRGSSEDYDLGFESSEVTGEFQRWFYDSRRRKISNDATALKDLLERLSFSIALLSLAEDADTLSERFLGEGFLGIYIAKKAASRQKRH